MNVNLWFARDNHGEIATILNSNIENTYTCPICNSEVIPKALQSKQITPHFAHIDRNKCTGESFVHFWMKHGFIERGDTFTIISDDKHTFTCKDFKTEVTFNLESGVYRPDILVETECGNEIVFEMANTNKKQVKDYIDRWIELDKIIVEVDVPTLTGQNEVKEFKALYYKGKCFNFNKRDGGYYNTIGKLKEEMIRSNKYDIEKVKKLDWFWDTVIDYRTGKLNIIDLTTCIDEILSNDTESELRELSREFLISKKCSNIFTDYLKYKASKIKEEVMNGVVIPGYMRDFIEVTENAYFNKYNQSYSVAVKDNYNFFNETFYKYEVNSAREKLIKAIDSNIDNPEILLYRKIQINKDLIQNAIEQAKIEINNDKVELSLSESLSKFNLNRIIMKYKGCYIQQYIEITEDVAESSDLNYIVSFIINQFKKYECLLKDSNDYEYIEKILSLNFRVSDSYIVSNKITPNLFNIHSINSKARIDLLIYDGNVYLDKKPNEYSYSNFEKQLSRMDLHNPIIRKVECENLTDKIKSYIEYKLHHFKMCKDCYMEFEICESEMDFFNKNGLQLPKRCKSCRNKRKLGGVK